jgi:hypothetical protein
MQEELDLLMDTWVLDEPEQGAKVLRTEWVFKHKRNAQGRIMRHKARLVVQGYR